MTTTALTTGHITAALTFPPRLDTTAAVTVAQSLPGGWQLHPSPSCPRGDGPAVAVEVGDASAVTVEGATVRLRLSLAAATSATLAYATYTALERARQQHRMLTLHANAVIAPAGQGVMLLGNKGAGKTSVTLALGERGWTHAGDDLTVLAEHDNGLWLLPGKSTAAVRPPDPALWQAPKPIIPLEPFVRARAPLTAVIRLTVHPEVPRPRITPATPFSANEHLRLHEALARYTSGLPTPLTGPNHAPYGTVWPLDHPRLARWRTHLITRLEQHAYSYLYAPDPWSAADVVIKELNA